MISSREQVQSEAQFQLIPGDVEVKDNEYVAPAITGDAETMHGAPVFRWTRVPVETLFDYLEGSDTLEDFLKGFPTVSRAIEALEEAKQLLLARV
jgi:uncharacterized protein (DUF433 family)